MSRCYGAQAGDCPCDGPAEYHALTDWSIGTLLLCRDCVAWERQVDGLLWVHSLRPACPGCDAPAVSTGTSDLSHVLHSGP